MGILDRLRGRARGKKIKPSDSILHYELYEAIPGDRFKRIEILPERVEFEDLFNTRPGFKYSLRSRSKGGQLRTIWTRWLPGPLPVEARTVDPLAAYMAAFEPALRVGLAMGALQESIRVAFSWAIPQNQGGGNVPQYEGNLPALLHPSVPQLAEPWGAVLGNMAKAVGSGIREGLSGGKPGEEVNPRVGLSFNRPPPDPLDYLRKEGEVKRRRPQPDPV